MPRKMARQTLERHAGACYAGSRPYLGSGLLGTPENRYNLPHFRVHPGNPRLGVPMDPGPVPDYATVPADDWDTRGPLGVAYAYLERFRRTLEAVRRHVPPPARVIDIAGGNGNFSLALAQLGYEVVWNDLRAEMIPGFRHKDKKGRVSFRVGNALELDFPASELFDVVLATEVIEHVAHPDQFLAKLATFLKPGGAIVLTTPCGNYFRNGLPRFSDCPDPSVFESIQFQPGSEGHIFLLYIDEVEQLARRAGLAVERMEVFSNPLTSGHVKLGHLLKVLPRGAVLRVERLTGRLPLSIKFRLHTTVLAVLRHLGSATS
jgi:2-polyprenyl-3-methyl-5-hydroxy-6-metoxy-1,4-benzoquinol methylase